jgi:hypothetical protein
VKRRSKKELDAIRDDANAWAAKVPPRKKTDAEIEAESEARRFEHHSYALGQIHAPVLTDAERGAIVEGEARRNGLRRAVDQHAAAVGRGRAFVAKGRAKAKQVRPAKRSAARDEVVTVPRSIAERFGIKEGSRVPRCKLVWMLCERGAYRKETPVWDAIGVSRRELREMRQAHIDRTCNCGR